MLRNHIRSRLRSSSCGNVIGTMTWHETKWVPVSTCHGSLVLWKSSIRKLATVEAKKGAVVERTMGAKLKENLRFMMGEMGAGKYGGNWCFLEINSSRDDGDFSGR